jgi:ABC-2 type transport system ATP-binding protein
MQNREPAMSDHRPVIARLQGDAGTVELFGMDPSSRSVRERCGAMLQVSRLPEPITVREHIQLFSSYYPHPLPIGRMPQQSASTPATK